MTDADNANMRATADAELRGEPEEALRHYEAIPHFAGSLHHHRLRQLAELGDEAPGWLWSRWLTVQARRPLWTGSKVQNPDPSVLKAVEVAYPHGVEVARMEGHSMESFLCTLHERDWILRQLIVFEHGGLRELVEEFASPRLLGRADQVEQWLDAPMGAYRLDSDDDGQLQLTDLAMGLRVDVLDLGLAAEHWPGSHFLGRLVPTAASPHRMFEWRPLLVDEGTAKLVADRPGEWLSTVAARAREEALPIMFSYLDDDTSMIADLPTRSWLGLLELHEIDTLPAADGLIDEDDVALVVLGKLLRAAQPWLEGLGLTAARHFVESLLLEPGLYDRVASQYGGRRFGLAWRVLAGIVREPARSRCLRLAAVRASI